MTQTVYWDNEPDSRSYIQGESVTQEEYKIQQLWIEASEITQDFEEDIQDTKLEILLNDEDWRS